MLWLVLLLLVCSSTAFTPANTSFKLQSSLVTGLPTAKPVLELVTPDGAAQGDTDVLISKVIFALLWFASLLQRNSSLLYVRPSFKRNRSRTQSKEAFDLYSLEIMYLAATRKWHLHIS
jgi:hypothetical protein